MSGAFTAMQVLNKKSNKTIQSFIWLYLLSSSGTMAADLVGIYTLAETNDPQYRQAIYANLATQELKHQTRAGLLPDASFTANSFRNDQDISSSASFGASGDTQFDSHEYALRITQPLFRWDRFILLKQSNSRIQEAEANQHRAQQNLLIRVAENYFAVLTAMDRLEFAKVEKKSLHKQLEQTKQRFEVGSAAITDLQEAQAGYDRAAADEILAINTLDNSWEALREITGKYISDLDSLGDSMPLVYPEPNDIAQWTETAASQNMNIIAAKYRLENARQEIERQSAEHLPQLDLVANYRFDSSGGRFGDSETKTKNIGVVLNMPLYQGGFVNSKIREAEHLYTQSLEQLEQARRATQRQTRQAYLGIVSGISSVNAFNQAVTSSEIALRATEAGFKVGTRTAVDIVDSERVLLNAKLNYARARYDYLLNSMRLKRAAGTLSLHDLEQINHWLGK